jgi:hypothetical protein
MGGIRKTGLSTSFANFKLSRLRNEVSAFAEELWYDNHRTLVLRYKKNAISATASTASKEESRKFLEETFDIQHEEDDLEQGQTAQFEKRASSAACSEHDCDYESDGDHEHLIAHIARNRFDLNVNVFR